MIPRGFVSAAEMKNQHELRVIAYNLFLGDFWLKDAPMATKAREQGQFAERLALELALHSLETLLADLGTLCRVALRPAVKGARLIYKLAEPTAIQKKVFNLLKITPKPTPCSQ